METQELLRCCFCKQHLPKENFGKSRETYNQGYKYVCRKCDAEYKRKFYKKYKPLKNEIFLYQTLKARAKTKNIVFDLDNKDFYTWYKSQEKICSYCGIPEEIWQKIDKSKFWGASTIKRLGIDRKDNNAGYRLDNICLACQFCNAIKNSFFSYEEMKEIAEKFIKPKWKKLKNF